MQRFVETCCGPIKYTTLLDGPLLVDHGLSPVCPAGGPKMADQDTQEFLRNTRKRRDEKAAEEAARYAEEKARGKQPMKEKESLKRPATEAAEVPAPKRSGGVVIREPSEQGSKKKEAEKTSTKGVGSKKEVEKTSAKGTNFKGKTAEAKEVDSQGKAAKKLPMENAAREVQDDLAKDEASFVRSTPRYNKDLAERSTPEELDLVRIIVRDSVTSCDLEQMRASSLGNNIKTVIHLSYQTMARSSCVLRQYQKQLSWFGAAESSIDQARPVGHREIEAREAAEERLKSAEEQVAQGMADLQKRTSELEELQGRNAELAKETELRQIELATERSKTSELERLLREERARNDELQASLQARAEEEESMKAEAMAAHLKSNAYLEKFGAQLLVAYDEVFLNCKRKIVELFPDLDISNLTPPELP